jgi:type IV secretory pathway VirB10-like protein
MNMPAYPGNIAPPGPPPASRPPAPARRSIRRWALALTGVAVVMLAALVVVRFTSEPVDDAADEQTERSELAAAAAPDAQPVPDASAPAAQPVESAPPPAPAVKARPKKIIAAKPAKGFSESERSAPPIAPAPIATAPVRTNVAPTTVRPLPVSTDNAGLVPVTLTGCLEMTVNRDAFRLSDTDGDAAPRSRSWRTAFIKKRTTPVALIEAPDPHGLQVEVGKRVAATGLLIDREMKVSSVRVVGASCD